jgi:hypothetical protein
MTRPWHALLRDWRVALHASSTVDSRSRRRPFGLKSVGSYLLASGGGVGRYDGHETQQTETVLHIAPHSGLLHLELCQRCRNDIPCSDRSLASNRDVVLAT